MKPIHRNCIQIILFLLFAFTAVLCSPLASWLYETSNYSIHLLILIGIYLILAQAFNLSFGLGGIFNLAHVAAYSIGAYATALLATELNCSFLSCILASILASAIFSIFLSIVATKLSEDYFAVGTLAFSSIVSALLINWRSLTRGVLGIPNIPRPNIFGFDFYNNTNFAILLFSFVGLSLFLMSVLFFGKFGRSLKTQAENALASMSIGKSVSLIRSQAIMASSVFAGLAGSFFAYYLNYIDPSSFGLSEMVFVMTIVVLGKPGSFWGVVASTVFMVLLPEPLRFIQIDPAVLGPARQLLYALVLFFVVFYKREQLFPLKRRT